MQDHDPLEGQDWQFDISKAQMDLNFCINYPLESTIRDYVNFSNLI
jgi:hypothetical protein